MKFKAVLLAATGVLALVGATSNDPAAAALPATRDLVDSTSGPDTTAPNAEYDPATGIGGPPAGGGMCAINGCNSAINSCVSDCKLHTFKGTGCQDYCLCTVYSSPRDLCRVYGESLRLLAPPGYD